MIQIVKGVGKQSELGCKVFQAEQNNLGSKACVSPFAAPPSSLLCNNDFCFQVFRSECCRWYQKFESEKQMASA